WGENVIGVGERRVGRRRLPPRTYPSPLQAAGDSPARARQLVAKPDDDPLPLQAADGPERIALAAVGFDTEPGVEKPPEHAVGVALLKAAVPALRATRHEGNHLVHRPEPGELFLRSLPMMA